MGKIVKTTWVRREEDLPKLKGGPYGIITGANLKRRPPKSTEKDIDKALGSRQAGEGGADDTEGT